MTCKFGFSLPALSAVFFAMGCKTASKSEIKSTELPKWFQVFEKMDENAENIVISDFIKLNGEEWEAKSLRVDEYSRIPISGFHKINSKSTEWTPEELSKMSLDFVKFNREPFQLSDQDIDQLQVAVNAEDKNRVKVRSSVPRNYLTFESVETFTYQLVFEFFFVNGSMRSFINRSFLLPRPLQITTEPRISATDSRIRDSVLGMKFKYSNFAGQELETPAVLDSDVESVQLTIASRREEDGKLWVGLVYAIHVKLGELRWTVFVSSDSGRVEWQNQDFFT